MNIEKALKFLNDRELYKNSYPEDDLQEHVARQMQEYANEQLSMQRVMPRSFSKDAMKKAYVQGYRKRAINSELKYDEISEQYAITEFENWLKNLYEL